MAHLTKFEEWSILLWNTRGIKDTPDVNHKVRDILTLINDRKPHIFTLVEIHSYSPVLSSLEENYYLLFNTKDRRGGTVCGVRRDLTDLTPPQIVIRPGYISSILVNDTEIRPFYCDHPTTDFYNELFRTTMRQCIMLGDWNMVAQAEDTSGTFLTNPVTKLVQRKLQDGNWHSIPVAGHSHITSRKGEITLTRNLDRVIYRGPHSDIMSPEGVVLSIYGVSDHLPVLTYLDSGRKTPKHTNNRIPTWVASTKWFQRNFMEQWNTFRQSRLYAEMPNLERLRILHKMAFEIKDQFFRLKLGTDDNFSMARLLLLRKALSTDSSKRSDLLHKANLSVDAPDSLIIQNIEEITG